MAINNILTAIAATDAIQWESLQGMLAGAGTGDRILSINKSSSVVSWQTAPTSPEEFSTYSATYAALGIDSATDVVGWYT